MMHYAELKSRDMSIKMNTKSYRYYFTVAILSYPVKFTNIIVTLSSLHVVVVAGVLQRKRFVT